MRHAEPIDVDLEAEVVHARGEGDPLVDVLRDLVPEAMRLTRTPGLNLALARGGELAWEAGFGLADLAARTAMGPRTVAPVASISKLHVAVAVLQLVDDGLLDLDEPLAPRMRGLALRNPLGGRAITALDLLTFRSGLAPDTIDAAAGPRPLHEHLRDGLRAARAQEYGGVGPRWSAPVGERYQYSNFGIALLGHLVERVRGGGISFAEHARRRILAPLSMRDSAFAAARSPGHAPARLLRRLSTGYARFGALLVPTPAIHSAGYPAAGLLTTPGDQVRLLVDLAAGCPSGVLSAAGVAAMLEPRAAVAQEGIPADDGWWVGLVAELSGLAGADASFGHGGAFPWGWWTEARAYPRRGVALAVFTNKWDMVRWHNHRLETAPGLIADAVLDTLRVGGEARAPRESWAWRSAYLAGFTIVERCRALLGAPDTVDASAIEAMAQGAVVLDARASDVDGRWDADGFRRGAADALALGADPEAVARFLASPAAPVSARDHQLASLRWGRRGALPLPMPFWAEPALHTPAPG